LSYKLNEKNIQLIDFGVYKNDNLAFSFMEKTITVHDKKFSVSIHEQQILQAVKRIATQLSVDVIGRKPLFLCVLNGGFMFAADLFKHISEPCEISFVKFASYEGTESTGKVKELIGLNESVAGRLVVVIEDIVDTGRTMLMMRNTLYKLGASEVRIATLLLKPEALEVDVIVEYVAFQIPKDFVVGYGLDYDGLGRNYADIYKVIE